MQRHFLLVSLIAALFAPPAFAQASEPIDRELLAPQGQEQRDGRSAFYAAHMFLARENSGGLIGDQYLMRRAKLKGPETEIFKRTDPGLASYFDDPEQPKVFTRLSLRIGPDGKVANCGFAARGKALKSLADVLCPLAVSRARFTPAIRLDGKPAQDQFLLNFAFRQIFTPVEKPPLAIQRTLSVPAMRPPPKMTKVEEWPLRRLSRYKPYAPSTKIPTPVGLAAAPLQVGERAAAVAVSQRAGEEVQCTNVIPVGEQAFDDAVCDFVLGTVRPVLAAETKYRAVEFPYLVIGKNLPSRAVAAGSSMARYPKIPNEKRKQLKAEITAAIVAAGGRPQERQLAFSLDEQGRPTDCRIVRGSDNDAADIAACETARRIVTFSPPKDVFGRPMTVPWQGFWLE